jgi:uncharacterized protein YbjT (DUF2867 family)
MYAITGATGKVGSVVVNELLSKGVKVRATGRNTTKLRALADKGAIPLAGDINNNDFVRKAFIGAETVFCILPPVMDTNDYRADGRRLTQNYVNSIIENNVRYIVLLSSVGAHLGNGAGVIDRLADAEKLFTEALKDKNILILRPTYYMENFYYDIEMITRMGITGSIVKGDIKFPIISATDVGRYAALRLIELNFIGNTKEYILGPKDISFNEATSIIGKAIGKSDLKYVQMRPSDVKKAMIKQMGFSKNLAEGFIEMDELINNGKFFEDYKKTFQNRTGITFEEFAKSFAEEYRMHEVTI